MEAEEDSEVLRFDEDAWSVHVHLTGVGLDGFAAGHADVYRDGVRKCRLTLVGPRHDRAGAVEALAQKARDFIGEWSARGHTGQTGFAEL